MKDLLTPKKGMIFSSDGKPDIRFLAVEEGWIMMKKKGKSIPFIYNMLNFTQIFINANGYQLKKHASKPKTKCKP
jgi:hypothetical protein